MTRIGLQKELFPDLRTRMYHRKDLRRVFRTFESSQDTVDSIILDWNNQVSRWLDQNLGHSTLKGLGTKCERVPAHYNQNKLPHDGFTCPQVLKHIRVIILSVCLSDMSPRWTLEDIITAAASPSERNQDSIKED